MPFSLRIRRGPRPFVRFGCALLLSLFPWGVRAADHPAWRVVHGDVRVTCPMTVGGSFEARTASLTGSLTLTAARPAAFAGQLSVDLATLDTGIGLRNDHLRETYLEVQKEPAFGKAVLSDIHLGDVDAETFQGRTRFSGVFRLHGAERPVEGRAEIHKAGSSMRVEAGFPLLLADYGIAKAQYLGVGVKEEVEVKVSLLAEPAETALGGSR